MRVVYPGTFDPFTIGHKYVLEKLINLFGKENVTILIGKNPSKSQSNSERSIEHHIKTIHPHVVSYPGLISKYCIDKNIDLIIRGLRSVTDFETELDLAHWNDELTDNETTTMFIPTSPRLQKISSSAIKTLYYLEKDVSKYFANDYSYLRWVNKNEDIKYEIYFGKMNIGKSTYLKSRMEHYVDFDKEIWKNIFPSSKEKYTKRFKQAIMSGNYSLYSKTMDEMNRYVDWEKIFSNLPWNAYHPLKIEMSALGMWFDYIPKHIIADSKLIKLYCNPQERCERINQRGLDKKIESFDRFYSDPPFFDESILI